MQEPAEAPIHTKIPLRTMRSSKACMSLERLDCLSGSKQAGATIRQVPLRFQDRKRYGSDNAGLVRRTLSYPFDDLERLSCGVPLPQTEN